MATCPGLAFRSQITRSALSVPSNIAEGMERFSTKEKCQFLWIAKASCGELRTQMMIGKEIGYISESLAAHWIPETRELSNRLCGLIKKIPTSCTPTSLPLEAYSLELECNESSI
ncbi:hypothetical protein PMM47T1_02064 [Pseudomonas sp. M47T1]|nr:hypothetical protein PMM47T1_02064 [Pseudomonas sp. M47T1]